MGSVWQILLGWGVLGAFTILIIGIGFGVMSMTPPDFIIARVCFTAAAIILTTKTAIWLANFDAPRGDRALAAFFVLGLIGAGWVWAYTWVSFRQSSMPAVKTQPQSPSAAEIAAEVAKHVPREHDREKEASEHLTTDDKVQTTFHKQSGDKTQGNALGAFDNWLAGLQNPPSMSDIFRNDFPNTMRLTDDAIGIEWKDNGKTTRITRQLYLDFPANSKFVGFYVPTSDPMDPSRTAEACLRMAQVDAVQQALEDMPKKTPVLAGLAQPTTIQDLTFSGRVVIYHDDFLSVTQQADIIRAFAAKHYSVGFFGPSDFGKALGSWHRLHDGKAGPQ